MTTNSKIVAACRKALSGFDANDKADLIALLDPDVVFEFPKSVPYGGTYKGVDAFKAFWADLSDNYFEYFNYDAREIFDLGAYVVIPVRARAKSKLGRTMETEHCFLFKVSDGKIVHGRIYADTAAGRDLIEGLTYQKSKASA